VTAAPGPSPLQESPALARALGVERAFLKREDLLPWGGGNKARRFGALLASRAELVRRVFAMSNRGAHTFFTLAQMLPALAAGSGCDPVELHTFERDVGGGGYRDEMEAAYARFAGIRRRIGDARRLSVELARARLSRRPGDLFLGLGGRQTGRDNPYRAAVGEDRAALAAAGPATHLVAVASGGMAAGIAAGLDDHGLSGEVVGVLTAEPWGSVGLRLSHARRRGRVRIVRSPLGLSPATTTSRHLAVIERVAADTGVVVDPHHMAHVLAAAYAEAARGTLGGAVVLWVSCPRRTATAATPGA